MSIKSQQGYFARGNLIQNTIGRREGGGILKLLKFMSFFSIALPKIPPNFPLGRGELLRFSKLMTVFAIASKNSAKNYIFHEHNVTAK